MAANTRNIRSSVRGGRSIGSCFGTKKPTRERPPEDFLGRPKGSLEGEKPGEDASIRLLEDFEW